MTIVIELPDDGSSWIDAEEEAARQRADYERYLRECDPLDEGR